MSKAKARALILFSGGLDSLLAAKILQDQGVETEGICFISNFFDCEKARISARALKMKLHTVNISKEILELVKNPNYGHGKNLNPCIDCHGLMIKMAGEFLKNKKNQNGFDFLATGEVLGQRPFSQNLRSLKTVGKIGGISVLRPLSAQNLSETEVEKKGLIDRNKLKKISGRGRGEQIELAWKYGLENFFQSGGGCLLTDPQFARRLSLMLKNWSHCSPGDVELLKHGRVYWITQKQSKVLVVVGREEKDNKNLEKLAQRGDVLVELKETTGPLTLIRGVSNLPSYVWRSITRPFSDYIYSVFRKKIPLEIKEEEIKTVEDRGEKGVVENAGILTGWFTPKVRGEEVSLEVKIVNS